MFRRVERVGREDEIVLGVVAGGIGVEIRPVEGAGRDGAGGGEGCVERDVVLEVWEDGREVREVGVRGEEGGGG